MERAMQSKFASDRAAAARRPGFVWLARAAPALLLAACSVGPDYHGPPPDPAMKVPARYKNESENTGQWEVAQPRDKDSRGPWWQVFHEPRLDDLENQALAANQNLAVAGARIFEARGQDRVAAADFYPNAQFDGSGIRMRMSNNDPHQKGELIGTNPFAGSIMGGSGAPVILNNQPLTTTQNLFRAPVDLNWELDLFGRVRRAHQAAREERQAVQADYQNMALAVTANVAINYFTLRALDAERDVVDRTIRTRNEALRIAKERLEAGLASDLDVTQAQADLANTEAITFELERTRGEVENALETLLGQSASSWHEPRRPYSGSPPRIPPGLPSSLLERRPDVASAERQLAAASERIGVAKAAFFPRINLTGAAGFESSDLGTLFNLPSRIWQIGPSITLPIFEGGRNLGNLQISQARYAEQVGQYRGQVLIAFQEVENSLVDLRTLAGQEDAVVRATSAAQRALQLAEDAYSKGQVNFIVVLDAERTSLLDERSVVELQGQRLQATVQLIKALGGDWK
jgi:multidrug efflux system outer membrane protein